jgi:hypothetical protein
VEDQKSYVEKPLAGSDEWEEFDATQEFRLILLGLGNFDIFHAEFDGTPFDSRAFSVNAGRTWEWNWYSNFSPR